MFLMQIFNNDLQLIHFVQKAMGYSLSGNMSEQCLFILWGTGANGKSTFLNVLQYLFGDYACSTMIGTFITECFEMDASLKWRLDNKLPYDTYLKWCGKNNERPLSHKGLSMRMQEKGFKRYVSYRQRYWLGLVLKGVWAM